MKLFTTIMFLFPFAMLLAFSETKTSRFDVVNLTEFIDNEVEVVKLNEFTFEFRLTSKLTKEEQVTYKKRLNSGVKFANDIILSKKSCKIIFSSNSTQDEIMQGLTFAIKTFKYKAFKITTHE